MLLVKIFVNSIKVADANSTDLTINQISVLWVKMMLVTVISIVISSSGPIDTYVKGIHLGSRTAGFNW